MKKYSRKEVAKMSPAEFAAAARGPYRKLLAYLKPFRTRFAIGLLCGAVYGGLNGILVYTVHDVTTRVLPAEEKPGGNNTYQTENFHADLELPELRAALQAKSLTPQVQEQVMASYQKFRQALHSRTLTPAPYQLLPGWFA